MRRKNPKRRSHLEDRVEKFLQRNKIQYTYEEEYLPYTLYYNPDFITKSGVILEVKGYLREGDPAKMIAVKKANPHLDIRLIFQKPHQRLPRRKLTHAQWADKHGFPWIGIEELSTKWLHT